MADRPPSEPPPASAEALAGAPAYPPPGEMSAGVVAPADPALLDPPPWVSLPSTQSDRVGTCPACGSRALWAEMATPLPTEEASTVRWMLLRLPALEAPESPPGRVWAVSSPAGRVLVVTPRFYDLHVCDPRRLLPIASGAYTAEVLARPCPVEFCMALPGQWCSSARQDLMSRPHGVRVNRMTLLNPDDVIGDIDDGE